MSHTRNKNVFLTLRCTSQQCKKVLGKVDHEGILITESSRSGSWIRTKMEKGEVDCKKCGNTIRWEKGEVKEINNPDPVMVQDQQNIIKNGGLQCQV